MTTEQVLHVQVLQLEVALRLAQNALAYPSRYREQHHVVMTTINDALGERSADIAKLYAKHELQDLKEQVARLQEDNERLQAVLSTPEVYVGVISEEVERHMGELLKAERSKVAQLQGQLEAARRVAVDLNLYGYKKAKLTPPATDELEIAGVLMKRVVLTPEQPRVTLELAGGREIQIQAWANVISTAPLEEAETGAGEVGGE